MRSSEKGKARDGGQSAHGGWLVHGDIRECPGNLVSPAIMANPRKFSDKIALHKQKEAQERAAFEAIMREVSDVTSRVRKSQ